MKKCLTLVCAMFLLGNTAYAADVPIYIEGEAFDGSAAFIDENGCMQAPLRAIAEELKCAVEWNPDEYSVTVLQDDDTEVTITIGSSTMYINGSPAEMDAPAYIIDGSTYMPIQAIAAALEFLVTYDDEQNVVYITNTKGSYIEVIDPMNDEDNTNPRNLFWQDFSVLDPNPLAEEWYTGEDEVPDEITEALNKEPGYIGEDITIETADFITAEENDPARKGSYDLSEGSYRQYFEFDKEKEVACFYNDVGFKSDTGRIAVMLESENITSDDLYLGLTLFKLGSRLQLEGAPKLWWHKVFDGKAIIVFDGLDADSYYSMWVQNVMDPDGDVDSVSAVMTIAEF